MNVVDRFLRYARLDTQSDPASSAVPSTPGQLAMLGAIADELRELGATEIELRAGAYLTATIPASAGGLGGGSTSVSGAAGNDSVGVSGAWLGGLGGGSASVSGAAGNDSVGVSGAWLGGSGNGSAGAAGGSGGGSGAAGAGFGGCEDAPVIGFLAHVDTSPDAPGAGVKPCVSGDWVITEGSNHPERPTAPGHDRQLADGVPATLLGADDKAGVAAIVTAAERLLAPDAPPHGRIRLAFTSDEEVGRGTQLFDTQHFAADFAYTVDGGALGELQSENFNAAAARVVVRGTGAHPGDARGKMVSALRVAMAIDASLPVGERAENTAGRDGFYHLTSLAGTVELAECQWIIRDFDPVRFEERKRFLREIVDRVAAEFSGESPEFSGESFEFSGARIELVITDQYRNMARWMPPEVVERARRAMFRVGVRPVEAPIRGGTDGARLTEMGLPCPNIFTGGENFHSTAERLHIPTLEKCVEVIVEIARNAAGEPADCGR